MTSPRETQKLIDEGFKNLRLTMTRSIAAEVSDVVNVAGAVTPAEQQRLWIGLYAAPSAAGDLSPAAASAVTVEIGTDGTIVLPASAAGWALFDTEADGTFDLDITDVVGGASLALIAVVREGSENGALLDIFGVVTDGS